VGVWRAPGLAGAPNVGKPLPLTAAALDAAAEVNTVDEVLARALWLHASPLRYAQLLDAVQVQEFDS